MKKIITKKHVFLIDEKESIGNDDCVYGKTGRSNPKSSKKC